MKRSKQSLAEPTGTSNSTSPYLRYGLRLAHVVRDAGGAQARAGPTEGHRVRLADHAHAFQAIEEDAIAEQQLLALFDHGQDVRGDGARVLFQVLGGRRGHATDAAEAVRQACAGLFLHQIPDHLARLDHPQKRGESPELHGHRAVTGQMIRHARKLAQNHPVPLTTLGHRDAQHLLARQREAHVVEHRRDVVAAIDVRENLRPGPALAHLLEATVQVTDLHVDVFDDLSAELHHAAHRAVHGRMRRADVEEHRLRRHFQLGFV